MINQQVFLAGITLLSNHYDRKLMPEVVGIWKKYLDAKLTTEQFQEAIKITLLESRFFPTAKELVEVVLGNADTNSLKDWDLCVQAAARSDRTLLDDLSSQGRSALYLIGGLHKIGMATEEQLTWIKKEFVGIWKSTPSDVKVLPQATSSGNASLETLRSLAEKMSFNGYQK